MFIQDILDECMFKITGKMNSTKISQKPLIFWLGKLLS